MTNALTAPASYIIHSCCDPHPDLFRSRKKKKNVTNFTPIQNENILKRYDETVSRRGWPTFFYSAP